MKESDIGKSTTVPKTHIQYSAFDDLLDEVRPNINGRYTLEGYDNEVDGIEPYILIFHNCPDRLGLMVTKISGYCNTYCLGRW